MALTDILRQRTDQSRHAAQVDCGGLGVLTVEALPLRECALLSAEPDPARSIFYAACRELQHAGEILRQEGKVFRPEDIIQHISDEEAALAAKFILMLSGWRASAPSAEDEWPTPQEVSLPGQTALTLPTAGNPPSAAELFSTVPVGTDNTTALQTASSVPEELQSPNISPARFIDNDLQSGLMARRGTGNLSVQAKISVNEHNLDSNSSSSSLVEAASAQIMIPQQREDTADTFARQLLLGLRRAAAVR